MPKDTFFNLESKKRKKIMSAAKKEFTRAPLDKVKVSNIVNNAEIPRGSFYQYFENIDDLFYFFIEEIQLERETALFNFTKQNKGDLFEYSKKIFSYEYEEFVSNNRHVLMMNIYKSMALNTEYLEKYNMRRKKFIIKLLGEICVDNLRYSKEDELIRIFLLIQDQRRGLIHRSTFHDISKEETAKKYNWYLDVFKYGMLKEEPHE